MKGTHLHMMQSIKVRHHIEVAHRLYLLPGTCQNIHGHSMWVTMELFGEVDSKGILEGLDFSSVKQTFRKHLDTTFDHRLLLNEVDPIIIGHSLPGQRLTPGDPTTENIARWVGHWAIDTWQPFVNHIVIEVQETSVNFATWDSGLL